MVATVGHSRCALLCWCFATLFCSTMLPWVAGFSSAPAMVSTKNFNSCSPVGIKIKHLFPVRFTSRKDCSRILYSRTIVGPVASSSGSEVGSEVQDTLPTISSSRENSIKDGLQSMKDMWLFCRPTYLFVGGLIPIVALHAHAAPSIRACFTSKFMKSCLTAALPSFFINTYIYAINQWTDIEIDRVSKPFLALPTGRVKRSSALLLSAVTLSLGLLLGHILPVSSPSLAAMLWISALFGTLYSIEPFRFKRNGFITVWWIALARGFPVNIGITAHAMQRAFGLPIPGSIFSFPKAAGYNFGYVLAYFTLLGSAISISKDIPDMDGDRVDGCRTLPIVLGAERALSMSCFLNSLAFGTASIAMFAAKKWIAGSALGFAFLRALRLSRTKDGRAWDLTRANDYWEFTWICYAASHVVLALLRFA